jgi:hypothetical protein
LNFLNAFFKKTQISNLIKIRDVGAEFFHTDDDTGMTKLIVSLRNFANAPINVKQHGQFQLRVAE